MLNQDPGVNYWYCLEIKKDSDFQGFGNVVYPCPWACFNKVRFNLVLYIFNISRICCLQNFIFTIIHRFKVTHVIASHLTGQGQGTLTKRSKVKKHPNNGTLYSQTLILFNLLEILIERFKPAPLPFPIKNRIVEYSQLAIESNTCALQNGE